MFSVTTANLHVLTPMWITTRLTSLFLGILASQWLTSMVRPETLMFWRGHWWLLSWKSLVAAEWSWLVDGMLLTTSWRRPEHTAALAVQWSEH